jgi:formylglycine-generating enzyme
MRYAPLCLVVWLASGCGRVGFDATDADPLTPDASGAGDSGAGWIGEPDHGNCEGLLATCGADGRTSCCRSHEVPGGEFLRGNDARYPARVSPFVLDRYEVTVGRFRRFVTAGQGVRGHAPPAGSGAHPRIPGSGWDPAWDDQLLEDAGALIARLRKFGSSTFEVAEGPHDTLPVVAVSWFEAFAFCAWDGGRLPTFAELQFARVGGDEQRVYPWSAPPSSTAISQAHLANGPTVEPVGASSPLGDGRYGQADLVGNVDEWVLDYFGVLVTPCDDCANLAPHATRLLHGQPLGQPDAAYLASAVQHGAGPAQAIGVVGFRCAR